MRPGPPAISRSSEGAGASAPHPGPGGSAAAPWTLAAGETPAPRGGPTFFGPLRTRFDGPVRYRLQGFVGRSRGRPAALANARLALRYTPLVCHAPAATGAQRDPMQPPPVPSGTPCSSSHWCPAGSHPLRVSSRNPCAIPPSRFASQLGWHVLTVCVARADMYAVPKGPAGVVKSNAPAGSRCAHQRCGRGSGGR